MAWRTVDDDDDVASSHDDYDDETAYQIFGHIISVSLLCHQIEGERQDKSFLYSTLSWLAFTTYPVGGWTQNQARFLSLNYVCLYSLICVSLPISCSVILLHCRRCWMLRILGYRYLIRLPLATHHPLSLMIPTGTMFAIWMSAYIQSLSPLVWVLSEQVLIYSAIKSIICIRCRNQFV